MCQELEEKLNSINSNINCKLIEFERAKDFQSVYASKLVGSKLLKMDTEEDKADYKTLDIQIYESVELKELIEKDVEQASLKLKHFYS